MDRGKGSKRIKIHNKSDKPYNILEKEAAVTEASLSIEEALPRFMRGFFAYLRGNVLPMTRLAYLRDIRFFCQYLIRETDICQGPEPRDITQEEFDRIRGVDVNLFLDYCRRYRVETGKSICIYENQQRSLARKRSSLSVLFKFLYRDELMNKNITDSFDPIRVPKPGEREIKALQDHEVMIMLDNVESGGGLTKKELQFWEKTKKRDKAILILFLTYGLRLSELQQLNLSSFHFTRDEFIVYRKRGKESVMPLNRSVRRVLDEYLSQERPAVVPAGAGEEDALFLSLQGKRMTERQIRELVKKYTAIGLQTDRRSGYSPHKLRATAATSLIGRGNSIFDVQALLDHEQVTTTQLYAAHRKNVKRELVKGMEWEIEREDGK